MASEIAGGDRRSARDREGDVLLPAAEGASPAAGRSEHPRTVLPSGSKVAVTVSAISLRVRVVGAASIVRLPYTA
ncbi:MAG: hypothetical protein M3018_15065, partial [Actinomycetota bacterium]|nr:hypothetical protein [Actinomycetota bacterium]